MGQLITVTRKPAVRADVAIFELNRSLSGMGHERYRASEAVTGSRPVDELARRLIAAGGVEGVHIYSNVVTVDLAAGADPDKLMEIIGDLFTYYREGVAVVDPMAGAAG
ncbi:MAG: hypothetical protein ACRD0Q_08000 [Acidimicrobiales bacterium]